MGYTKFINKFITRPPPIWWLTFKYVSFLPSHKSITSCQTDLCKSSNPVLFASWSETIVGSNPSLDTRAQCFCTRSAALFLPAYAFHGFVHRCA